LIAMENCIAKEKDVGNLDYTIHNDNTVKTLVIISTRILPLECTTAGMTAWECSTSRAAPS
jgi:hypothetical protein